MNKGGWVARKIARGVPTIPGTLALGSPKGRGLVWSSVPRLASMLGKARCQVESSGLFPSPGRWPSPELRLPAPGRGSGGCGESSDFRLRMSLGRSGGVTSPLHAASVRYRLPPSPALCRVFGQTGPREDRTFIKHAAGWSGPIFHRLIQPESSTAL